MGHGIAEVAALAGFDVSLVDITEDILANAMQKISWSLSKLVEKRRVSNKQAEEALRRITTTTSLEKAVAGADFVIEAVVEDLKLKSQVFSDLDRHAPPQAILATNTSTLPITEVAASTQRPGRVIGMHFFNPPPLMPLVEITRGEKTSDETLRETVALAEKMGKEYVICMKDVPGFIVNRILAPLLNEACWTVRRGEAKVVEIDSAVRYRVGLPMGLFELADHTGVDVVHLSSQAISSRDPLNVVPCPTFKEYYDEGRLGRKTRRGFYEYGEAAYERPTIPRDAGEKVDLLKVFAPAINAAAWIIRNGVATTEDVEKSVKLALGFPRGLLEMADAWGLDNVVNTLLQLREKYGNYYTPDPLLTKLVEEGKLGEKSGEGFHRRKMGETYAEIIIRRDGPLAWLIINRAQSLNTITLTMIGELRDALEKLEADDSVKTLIIRGAGERAFSAGMDVKTFLEFPAPHTAFSFSQKFQELTDKIESIPKPVIAAIDGYALGGGCELSLACDFRIATTRSELGQPEVRLGLIPGAGGTQRLVRLIGLARAKELVMTGERITADEALRIGLVNRVVEPERLEEEVRALALKLSELSPVAVRAAKVALNYGTQAPLSTGQAVERSLFSMLFSTEDLKEGVSAFLSKRKPQFKGR